MTIAKCFLIALFSFVAASAQAAITITIEEVGSDVVVTGSGTIDLAGLTFDEDVISSAGIVSGFGIINVGSSADQDVTVYDGVSGLAPFGSGAAPTIPDSGSGDIFGFAALNGGQLAVPLGYVSGSPLSATSTYTGATISSLELTPGIYNATWGSGSNADLISMTIVPEPGTYAALLGLAALGVVAYRRRK